MSSGELPGLQNRRAASSMSPVRSTRTRFRQNRYIVFPAVSLPFRANRATFPLATAISSVTIFTESALAD